MECEILQEEINKSHLFRCEGVNIGDVLHYTLQLYDENEQTSSLRMILSLIKASVSDIYEYEIKGTGGNTVALYSISSGYREDHLKAFEAATDLVNCAAVKCTEKFQIRPLSRWSLFEEVVWYRQLRKIIKSKKLCMVLVRELSYAYGTYIYLERLEAKKKTQYKNLLTWCDVMPAESFVTQKLRTKNRIVASFCHSDYNINRDDWPYRHSYSSYILVHSSCSAHNAELSDCRAEIIVTGDPHALTKKKPEKRPCASFKTIGLVINSKIIGEINMPMIEFMKKFCRKTGRRLLIKPHPTYPDGFFDKCTDEGTMICGRSVSIQEFADLIDIAVVSNSNVFTEMLYLWKPVFIYRGQYDYHCYEDIEGIHFSDESELERLLSLAGTAEMDELIVKCREYYVIAGDVREAYKKAYRHMGME